MAFQDYAHSTQSRLHLGQIKPQLIIGIALITLGLIGTLIYGLSQSGVIGEFGITEAEAVESPEIEDSNEGAEHITIATIQVHVTGCVVSPDVYTLNEGSRVSDAVQAAGGLTAEASETSMNLARLIEDGEQILIPSIQEAVQAREPSQQVNAAQTAESSSTTSAKVNINSADITQLQTLSGIGASKAQKIVAYREQHGPFKSIDDLANVSGIGEKTLESLRESICV